MTTTAEQAAFLAAIRENPADDTVRLVYADWLDENGQPERAEFIRVQIATHSEPQKSGMPYRQWKTLVSRAAELFNVAGRGLLDNPLNDFALCCPGSPTRYVAINGPCGESSYTATFSRGFVSAVTTTAAAFLGAECGCNATVRHINGGCDRCGSPPEGPAGRTPGIAGELFAAHPIERVTLSDKRPWSDVPDGGVHYGWWLETEGRILADGPNDPDNLPAAVFEPIWKANPANRRSDESNRWLVWDDETIPSQELSAACVALGRSLAGLEDV